MISFSTTRDEHKVIQEIADRAAATAKRVGKFDYDRIEAEMDITAVHANGCPLRLNELLAAEQFDFAHDVFGIRAHLDRETGQLKDCFSPRYAV